MGAIAPIDFGEGSIAPIDFEEKIKDLSLVEVANDFAAKHDRRKADLGINKFV